MNKVDFLLVRCLYSKQNHTTWLLGDMEFLFSGSTQYLLRSLRSLLPESIEPLNREIPYFN